ncbi:hypothetical protein [Nocardia sp. NPDC050412]|uniref:hypothetical protein n=1 Tax=Nocardia sp. NPDC050412 TaxID=3364320 RepID=UPI0037A8C96F
MPTVVAAPAFQLSTGYTRFTLTPRLTRVSVATAHQRHRDVLATAALIIRTRLDERNAIKRRMTGNPTIAGDGTIHVTLTDRTARHRHTITITPTQIATQLRQWTTP